jgi:hypothetical protein
MSIIQEALKKAQNKQAEKKADNYSEPPKVEQPVIIQKKAVTTIKKVQKAKPFLPKMIFFVLLAVAVVVAGIVFFMPRQSVNDTPTAVITPVTSENAPSRQEVVRKSQDNSPEPANSSVADAVNAESAAAPKMAPSSPSAETPPSFILNGIMYLEKGPKAIIDGSTVIEGDVIKGATVVKINPNSVILNFNDLEIRLNLKD